MGYWSVGYADRHCAVANQRLCVSSANWTWAAEYNRRLIAKTAMYRIKQLSCGLLGLRDDDGQVAKALAMARALNKMTL